jgi:hypothetical protein
MNRQESARIVAVVLAACPTQSSRLDRDRATSMVDAYATLLSDLPYEHVNAAVAMLLQTRTWMPSVADIRSAVLELQRGPKRTGSEAWASVVRAMREQGAHRHPGEDFVFHDPLTARCVQAMGWRDLCLSENTVADRARFIELYDSMAAPALRAEQSPVLATANQRRLAAGERIGDTIANVLRLPTGGGS